MNEWIKKDNVAFDYIFDRKNIQVPLISPISELFKIRFRPARRVFDFRTEVANTAKHIRDKTSKDIVVSFGGGIDGEVVVRGFIDAGIPVRCLIVDNGMNDYDTLYAKNFCVLNKIPYDVVSINIWEYIQTNFQRYLAQGYRANAPFRYLQLFVLETIDNMNCTCVMGGGVLSEDKFYVESNQFIYHADPCFLNAVEWQTEKGIIHFPYFYQARPEMIAGYLKDPLMQFNLNNPSYFQTKIDFVDNVTASIVPRSLEKILIYHTHYPHMKQRPKFHGFENQEFTNYWRANRHIFGYSALRQDSILRIPYEQIKRELRI